MRTGVRLGANGQQAVRLESYRAPNCPIGGLTDDNLPDWALTDDMLPDMAITDGNGRYVVMWTVVG